MAHNKTLHLTAIPLRSIAAGELGRYATHVIFVILQKVEYLLNR